MSTFLITQTPFSSVRPIDPSVQLTGHRLRKILGGHLSAEDMAEVSALFADPEPVVGAAATDWYTDYADAAVAVAELEPEARDKVLAEVGRICAKIANVADTIETEIAGSSDAAFLRVAIAIPDNNTYVYAFGEKPVIVAWGHKLAGSGKVPVPAGIWVKSATPPPVALSHDEGTGPDASDADQPVVLASGPVTQAGGIGWLAWLLWLLFLILFLIILWLLFSACSMGGPQTTLAQRLGLLNRCPVPIAVAEATVISESRRNGSLQEAIREAELALAEGAQQCRVVRRQEDEERRAAMQQTPQPVPAPDPQQSITDEIDERVREAGGQSGEMQVVLQWDGPADLDLIVNCSGGRISYNNRAACDGGELDVDANYEIDMDRPVENIRWEEEPPSGTYGLSVRNHNNNGDQRSEIPFNVLVRQGDDERTYSGRVSQGRSVSVTDITVE